MKLFLVVFETSSTLDLIGIAKHDFPLLLSADIYMALLVNIKCFLSNYDSPGSF